MKQLIIGLFITCIGSVAWGQAYTIKGVVLDEKMAPLEFVDVSIFKVGATQILEGGITDAAGKISLNAANGQYYAIYEFADFISDTLKFEVKNADVDLGTRILKSEFSTLDAVTFVAQKSAMELKLDKRVYNVDADLNNQGTTASEMLENIPSVTVDAEGNVSLRGNQSVRILIDGKYSGFASSADALKQLQSDQIEKVEIVTNASARYDAQGDAGIINIILKKNRRSGWSGAVNLRAGYFPEAGGGVNLNYRKNKANFFFNYNINKNESPANSTTYQRLTSPDTSFAYFQNYNHERRKFRNDGTIGMDYDFNDRNTITASFNMRSGKGNNFYDREYENLGPNDESLSRDTRLERNIELEDLLEATVSYKHKLRKKGGEWNTEIKGFRDQDFERSNFNESTTLSPLVKIEKSHAFVTEKFGLFQSDFIYPVGLDGKVEAGVRSQWRNLDNRFGFSRLAGSEWDAPSLYNDDFNYDEKVYAAYVMGAQTFKKFSAQLGLRAEYSDITTLQESEGAKKNKSYLNLFPSAAFSYKMTDNSTLQLSYSKRIHRPGQWDLMPFMKFGDNREMRVGNPDINPEITHSFEGGWMQYFTGGSILSSLYYKRTNDKIERMAELGPNGIIYRVPMNISSRDAMGFELNGNYSPCNWLRLTTGFNFYREVVKGTYEGQGFDIDNFSWTNRTSVNVTLPYKIKFQASANYQAPSVRPQGKTLAIFYGDLGLSKDFWKDNATIGVNVRDVLNSRRWKTETTTPTIYSMSDFQWRPRSVRVTFTYRFNQNGKDVKKDNFDAPNEGMEG